MHTLDGFTLRIGLVLDGNHLIATGLNRRLRFENLLLFLTLSPHKHLHSFQLLQLALVHHFQIRKLLLLRLLLLLAVDNLLLHLNQVVQNCPTLNTHAHRYLEHATRSSSVSSGRTISTEYTTSFSRSQEYVLSQIKEYSPVSANTIFPCCGQSGG